MSRPARGLGVASGSGRGSPRAGSLVRRRCAFFFSGVFGLSHLIGCAPPEPPGFGPSTDVEDTGGDSGERDPFSWLEDHWTVTAAACQPPSPFVRWSMHVDNPSLYSDACQEALTADLGLDEESFALGYQGQLRKESLLEEAYYLLARDQGSIEALGLLNDEDDIWAVREPFIEQITMVADVQGYAEVRWAVYDLVMSSILRTVYDDELDADASINRSTRTMTWGGTPYTEMGAVLLVHEATHVWLNVGHVECPEGTVLDDGQDFSGERSCDADWGGAWGFQAATARLMLNGAAREDPENSTTQLDSMIRVAGIMIIED
jgi:hypothetical protein